MARLGALCVVLVLLGGSANVDAACLDTAACVQHTPYVRFAERVQVVEPGETIRNEVTLRNTDGCRCPRTCFSLSYGPHFPQPGSNALRITSTSLTTPAGDVFGPSVCLEPGEERTAFYVSRVAEDQALPAYVNPSLMVLRHGTRPNNGVDWYDAEGPALCAGFTERECAAFVYAPAEAE